ncbi:hypothetical protein ACOME3_000570 [Neoechinorhynchus agilis]
MDFAPSGIKNPEFRSYAEEICALLKGYLMFTYFSSLGRNPSDLRRTEIKMAFDCLGYDIAELHFVDVEHRIIALCQGYPEFDLDANIFRLLKVAMDLLFVSYSPTPISQSFSLLNKHGCDNLNLFLSISDDIECLHKTELSEVYWKNSFVRKRSKHRDL